MKRMQDGSILRIFVFCITLCSNEMILSGSDISTSMVLPGSFPGKVVVQPVNLRCEYLVNPLGIDVATPRLSWAVASSENGQIQSAYQILVASSAIALKTGTTDIWDSGVVNSDETLNIHYAGKKLISGQRCYWQVSIWDKYGNKGKASDIAWFEMGLFSPDDWKGGWIIGGHFNISPLLRRSFNLGKEVVSARLYICGQGVYEAFINGSGVSNEVLGPTLSYYSKRMFYDVYDVTHLVRKGDNALGVWLAPGWFGDPSTWAEMEIPGSLHRFPYPPHALIAQMEIRYTDGSSEVISTDDKWKSAASPMTPVLSHWKVCFGWSGETYDATQEPIGWNTPDFNDRGWSKIKFVTAPTAQLSSRMIEPNRFTNTTEPVKREIIEKSKSTPELMGIINRYNLYNGGSGFSPEVWFFEEWQKTYKSSIERCGGNFQGGWVYDLGRHISGWVEIKAKGRRGDWVCMFGMDCYRLKGDVEETIRLHFIHRVVRYVPVFFFGEAAPEIISVKGLDINNDVEPAGKFTCSDPSLTELSAVMGRTIQAHMLSGMMMDSWQERFGTFVPGEASVYNWNLPAICNKLTTDFRDQQSPDGGFNMLGAPISMDYPTLKDILVSLPWLSYLYYGDRDILEANYQSIKRYTELIIPKHDLAERTWRPLRTGRAEAFSGDHGRPSARWYEPHTGDLFETMDMSAYFQTLESIARLLGENADANRYRDIRARLIEKANRPDFLNRQEGLYGGGDQGCHALALAQDIVPEELKDKVAGALIQDIMEKRDGHLNTGFKGSVYLLQTLIKLNRPDVACRIISNEKPPSFWTMLNHPQTPERLTIMPEFYTGGMIPHPGLSTVGFWFYQGLGGIRPDPEYPGFRRIIICPQIPASLTWVNAEFKSVRGMIANQWEKDGKSFRMKVVIPANTEALIHVPGRNPRGTDSTGNKGLIKKVDAYKGYTVFSIPGGIYSFKSQLE